MSRTPWIVVYDGSRPGTQPMEHHCTRCDTRMTLALPMPVAMVANIGKAFVATHRRCKP